MLPIQPGSSFRSLSDDHRPAQAGPVFLPPRRPSAFARHLLATDPKHDPAFDPVRDPVDDSGLDEVHAAGFEVEGHDRPRA